MSSMQMHRFELDRLDSLASYAVLDSAPESSFDALTALAARVCHTPTAAVNLLDATRTWPKSSYGAPAVATPRRQAFCSDVVAAGAILVVPDAATDPRYCDNPHVVAGHVRAYAGVPLAGRDGLPLGALCVADRRPRRFNSFQIESLIGLASQVVVLLEQRRRDHDTGLFHDALVAEARNAQRLRAALDAGQLLPHYQPLVDLRSGRTVVLEALLRWEHPELGTLPPAAFLPAVEAGSLIVPVGRAVLEAALSTLADLDRSGLAPAGGMAVNVASGQLARPGLAVDVLAALARHDVAPARLHLEITETTALPDPALAYAELSRLTDVGVHVVIDDFGVGWSNLSRVLELPVDALKLDRSIAGAVLCDPRAAAMVEATVALATGLGLQVTAEGIESEAVRRRLTAAGCQWGQGWLFSAAVPRVALPHLLRNRTGHRNRSHLPSV